MRFIWLLSICFLFVNCETPSGHIGVSNDIKESKKRNVFISEYTCSPNPYKINDTLQITIKEAWVEHRWFHSLKEEETLIDTDGDYQLCINTNEKDLIGVCFDWTVGVDFYKNLRLSSKNSLLGDFKSVPTDTIEFKVQAGNTFNEDSSRKIIGKFVLIKK